MGTTAPNLMYRKVYAGECNENTYAAEFVPGAMIPSETFGQGHVFVDLKPPSFRRPARTSVQAAFEIGQVVADPTLGLTRQQQKGVAPLSTARAFNAAALLTADPTEEPPPAQDAEWPWFHKTSVALARDKKIAEAAQKRQMPTGRPKEAGLNMSHMPPRLQSVAHQIEKMTLQGRLPEGESLQGVDLRLDQFDLSEVKHVSLEARAGSWGDEVGSLDECVEVGSMFFASLDGSKKFFRHDDLSLLRSVFASALSDRRSEGDLFIPPDASHSHVQKLRELVKAEETVRQLRKDVFCSQEFLMAEPGSLFPHSWRPAFEITHGRKSPQPPEDQPRVALHARPEYKEQTTLLAHVLKTSSPIFDNSTEEGLRFRIYRIGSLQVRTTQEPEGPEIVGAVFSTQDKSSKSGTSAMMEQETIIKVTECVENAFDDDTDESSLSWRYYQVHDTVCGLN